MKKKILVCDDHPRIARDWASQIEGVCPSDFAVESVAQAQLVETIGQLETRRRNARRPAGSRTEWTPNRFDEADILVIDYDLLDLGDQTYMTGENVAYLARCYSRCGIIVGLNQFGPNDFDLSLKGHPESFADLNVGGEQISSPGLWRSKWNGFRPWHWPLLPAAVNAFRSRVRGLKNNLDEPILNYLGFKESDVPTLPRSTKEFLSKGKDVVTTTFRDFVRLPGNGLRAKDKQTDDESITRIAAARVWKWLERMVLAGQDIVVDAPHLVSRFPSLLKGSRNQLASWNKTSSLASEDKLGIDYRKIGKCRLHRSEWLSRPAWHWKCVCGINSIKEVANPWDKQDISFVFCEDISAFLPRSSTRGFVADLPSPFVQRSVSNPASRECRAFAETLRRVNYRPRVRFSL